MDPEKNLCGSTNEYKDHQLIDYSIPDFEGKVQKTHQVINSQIEVLRSKLLPNVSLKARSKQEQTLIQLRALLPSLKPGEVLGKIYFPVELSDCLNRKIAFQMLSDYWGRGKKTEDDELLEGYYTDVMLKYMQGMVTYSSKNEILIAHFQQAAKAAEKINELTPEEFVPFLENDLFPNLKKLSSNSMLFIPIGWTGAAKQYPFVEHLGHAMMLQIVKTESENFILRILNTGSGLECFHVKMKFEVKQKYSPCCEWPVSSEQELCNLALWKNLLEPGLIPSWYPEQRPYFSNENIYLQMEQHLGPPTARRNIPVETFISDQRAGTCSKKAGDLIARLFLEKAAYKRYKIELNLNTLAMLHQKWNQLGDPLRYDSIILEIMTKGIEALEGALIRAIKNQVYEGHRDEQDYAIALLSDLIEAIEEDVSLYKTAPFRSDEYFKLEAMKFPDCTLPENSKALCEILSVVKERHEKIFLPCINADTGFQLEEGVLRFPSTSGEIKAFLDALDDISDQLALFQQRPPFEAAAHFQKKILDILPIPSIEKENQYSLFSDNEALRFCICLRKIANHLFYWTMGRARRILPEHTVAFWKMYTIGIELAAKSNPTLKEQKFNWILLKAILESRRFLIFSESQRHQFELLINFFSIRSPGSGDISFSASAPFFAFYLPSLYPLGYPREEFIQLSEWRWLESHLTLELIEKVRFTGQIGHGIEEVIRFLTKQSFKNGTPAYITEYIALRDLAYYAMSSCQREIIPNGLIDRKWRNDYELDSGHNDCSDYHSQCWMDINDPSRMISEGLKSVFKTNPRDKTRDKEEQFAKKFSLAVFGDEFFAQKALKQPEIWRKSLLDKSRQEAACISAQTSYDFSIINEAPDDTRLPLLFDLVEKEPQHLHKKDFRFYFFFHFFEAGKFNDQAIHEPAFLIRVQRLLERLLLNGQRDLTKGLSLNLWEHDLFLLKIASAVLRLSPHFPNKNVGELIVRYRENLIHYLLQNEELLRIQGEEGLLGSISHHILMTWEDWPKENGLPPQYFSILKIAGRFPLNGIWEDAHLSQQVQNMLYSFSPLIQKHTEPRNLIALLLKEYNEEHLAEYPVSDAKPSEDKKVLELRLKRIELKAGLTKKIHELELYKAHLQSLKKKKEAGFTGFVNFEISNTKDRILEIQKGIIELQNQIQQSEKEIIEMVASIEAILPQNHWIVSFPIWTLAHNGGKVVQIDLAQGKVYHDGIEEIGSILPSRIRETPSISKFGNLLSLPVNRKGICYTLCDPCFSHLSFYNDESMSVDISWEGVRYTLLSDAEKGKLTLPELFKKSTLSYWIDVDKVDTGQLLICLHDKQGNPIPIFIMNTEGDIIPVKQRNLSLVDIRKKENTEALSLFSRLSPNMNDALAWKGLDNDLQRVELPCTTDSSSWLAFVKPKGNDHWSWETNPNYRVMSLQQFPFLSHYRYYLVLENAEGERLILINPLRLESLKLRSKGKVRQAPALPVDLGTQLPPNGHPQESLIQYSVNNRDEPVPLNCTGSLYLAYIKLLDSNYAISLDLLRQSVPVGRGYTIEELDLLRWIIDSNNEEGDRHPGACAVRLFAAAKAINHLKNYPFKEEEVEKFNDDWSYKKPLYDFFFEYFDAIGKPLLNILTQDYKDYAGHTYVSTEWRLDRILTYQEQWSIADCLVSFEYRYRLLKGKPYLLPTVSTDKLPLYILQKLEEHDIALFDGEIDEIDIDEKLFKNQTWGGLDFSKFFWYAYAIAKNKYTDPKKALMLKELLQFRQLDREANALYKESDNKLRIDLATKTFGIKAQTPVGVSTNQSLYAILNSMLDAQDISVFPDLPSKNCPEIERKAARKAFFEALAKYYNGGGGVKRSLNQFQHFVSPIPDNIKLPKDTENKFLNHYNELVKAENDKLDNFCWGLKNEAVYSCQKTTNKELIQECKDYPELLILLENLETVSSYYYSPNFAIPKEWNLPTVCRTQIFTDATLAFPPSLGAMPGCYEGVTKIKTDIQKEILLTPERRGVLSLRDRESLKPLEEALYAFNMEEERITYTIDKRRYDDLDSGISMRLNELTSKESELEKQILRIASALPDCWTTEQKLEHLLGRLKGAQRTFDINACIGLVLQGLPVRWEELVGVAQHERNDFKKLVAEYLIYKTEIQLCERLQKKISGLSLATGEEQLLLMQEVGQMLDSKRDYNCLDNFEILVYEYFANIRLYPKQVNVIKLLAKVQHALQPIERHRVIQLIMGAGKSQILGPILAYLAADGEHISTITATEQLYGTSKFDWSQKIYRMFRRNTETLEFNREECGINLLKRIRLMLATSKREGRVVVTRPNDLLSLQMMLSEHLEQIRLIRTRYNQICKEWILLNAALIPKDKQEPLLEFLTNWIACEKYLKNTQTYKGKISSFWQRDDDTIKISAKLSCSTDFDDRINAIKSGQKNLFFECLNLQKEIDELSAILEELGENQVNLIDEYDSVSHPLTQLSFPVGFPQKVSAEAIQLATDLYFDWLTEKEDLLQISQEVQSTFCTPENLETIMNFVVDKVIEKEGNRLNEAGVLKLYLSGKDCAETQQFYNYLTEKSETAEFRMVCERIAFMKHVVAHELSTALQSIAHTQYALSDKDLDFELVIPCEKGEKKEGARFRNPFETLLKTCQFYRQSWKRPDITKRMLEHYLKEMEIHTVEPVVISEIKKAFGLDHFYKLPLEDAEFLDQMTGTFEYYLKSTKPVDRERHKSALKVVQTYLREIIFPNQLTYDPCQVNGTPLDLAAIPKSNKGYSGTFANDRTWDPRVETIPDLKTDGATVSALLEPRNFGCVLVNGITLEEKIASCVAEMKNHPNNSALIDLGALFRGQASKKVVASLLSQMEKDGLPKIAILSYQKNVSGEWALTLWKRGATEPQYIDGSNEEDIVKACQGIPRANILTYYGYPHIIGSNITQPLFSHALVTVGDKTTIDHHLQAVMRMRKLGELAQFTTFLITKEVEDCIKNRLQISSNQKLTGADLLQHTQIQLKEMERVRNFQAIRKQLIQVLKNRFRKQIIREKDYQIREKLFETARPYLITEQGGTLFQQFGHIDTKMDPWTLLEEDFKRLEKVIPEQSISDEMKLILDTHKKRATLLPEKVCEHMLTDQEAVEVQSQAQMRVQQKMRQEEAEMRELEKMDAVKETLWPESLADDKLFIPMKSLQEVRTNCPSIYRLVNALENVNDADIPSLLSASLYNLFVTSNFIRSFVGKGNTLFTSLGNQVHHLLVVEEADRELKLIFITLEESAQFIQLLRQKPDTFGRCLFVIEAHGQTVQNGSTVWQDPFDHPEGSNEKMRTALVQAMVLQGDARRLKEARYYVTFKKWIKSLDGNQRNNIKILFEHSLSFRPDDKKIYDRSVSLHNIWRGAK